MAMMQSNNPMCGNYYGNVTSSLAWNLWNRRLAFPQGPIEPTGREKNSHENQHLESASIVSSDIGSLGFICIRVWR